MKIFEADLTSGSSDITTASSVVVWLKTLGTNQGSETCNLQGVVRITFPPSLNGKQKCRLKFNLHMLKDFSQGSGWNFNIGDSTNSGYGGDSGHTSNAAEVHNNYGNFSAFSNTLPGYTEYTKSVLLVDQQADVMTNNVTITVGDELFHFDNHRGIQRSYSSPYLFTLNGQTTTYGSPNYNIYFSMNRVIYPWQSTTNRTGIGLCKAVIRAVDCGPPQLITPLPNSTMPVPNSTIMPVPGPSYNCTIAAVTVTVTITVSAAPNNTVMPIPNITVTPALTTPVPNSTIIPNSTLMPVPNGTVMPTHNSTIIVSNSEQFSRLVTVSANKLIVLQVNISNQNVGTVIKHLAGIITSTNQTFDQNADNLKVVVYVLTKSAELIQAGNFSLEVANEV